MTNIPGQRYLHVIDDVCSLRWECLTQEELCAVAWAYYFFSVQFRENLRTACDLFPQDERLILLRAGECDTDNLSPYPGIAALGERMNHDEFMRRLIMQATLPEDTIVRLKMAGALYLDDLRQATPLAKAQSIASYEDGGLERVFTAILSAPDWRHPALQAFRHFLIEHIKFDSDPDGGHGALSRHLVPDDRILPLWVAFHSLLVQAVPRLQHTQALQSSELENA
jgi:hypothetical protein